MAKKNWEILPDRRIVSGWSFGDQRMIVIEPNPLEVGFIPLPGITCMGQQLYLRTMRVFEKATRLEARQISADLRSILEANNNIVDVYKYSEEEPE